MLYFFLYIFFLLLSLSVLLPVTLNCTPLMRQGIPGISSPWGKRSVPLKQIHTCTEKKKQRPWTSCMHKCRKDTCRHDEINSHQYHTHTHTHRTPHTQRLTHKSHLHYAEYQLADGGADYAFTSASPYLPVGYLPLNPNPKCLFSISIENYIFLNSRTCMHIVFLTTRSSPHISVRACHERQS